MTCCGRGKIKLSPAQQAIADKVNSVANKTPTPIQNYSAVKSNRARPGTIAKECPNCSTKTIGNICPVCSTLIP